MSTGKGSAPVLAAVMVLSVIAGPVALSGAAGAQSTLVVDASDSEGYRTIQAAIDDASASGGDVVTVRSGTYVEDVVIDKPVTLVANGSVVIEGAGDSHGAVEIAAGVSDVTIDGFTIYQRSSGHALSVETGETSHGPNANLTVRNNRLVAADGGFAVFAAHLVDSRVSDNEFAVESGSAVEIVYVGGARTYGTGRSSSNVDIVDNTFSGSAARSGQPGGALEFEANDSEVSGNDFSGVTTDDGVLAEFYGTGQVVEDNAGAVGVAGVPTLYEDVQTAVDAASAGDTVEVGAGTFAGAVTVGESLTLAGAGADQTTLEHTSTVVEIESTDVTIRDLTVANGSSGIRVGTDQDASGFRLLDAALVNNTFGMYVAGDSRGDPNGAFDDVVLRDVSIRESIEKGLYIEKLSNATFEGLVVDGVIGPVDPYNNGIDINVKDGNYTNVTIRDSVVRDVQRGAPLGGVVSLSAAIAIKARDDGVYASDPATLDGVLLDNVTVLNSYNGLRFGEPESPNLQPTNVTVRDSTFANNTGYHLQLATDSLAFGAPGFTETDNTYDRRVVVYNDTTARTPQTVWSDLGDAMATVEAGDVVVATGGIYNETLQIQTDNVTLRGRSGATIAPSSAPNRHVVRVQSENVTVSGVTITGNGDRSGNTGWLGVRFNGGNGTARNLTTSDLLTGVQTASEGSDGATIENVAAVDVGVGISTQGDATVTDSHVENASMSGAGILSGTTAYYARNTFVNVSGPAVSISDYPGRETTDGHVTLRRNDLSGGADGLNNTAGVLDVDARENYWGALSGPGGARGGLGVPVSANVSVEPYYVDRSMTTLSTNFTRTADIIVDDDGLADVTNISAALSAASPGDEILVRPGTYDENVLIDVEDVTLTGPNAGVSGTADRGDEAVVEGQFAIEAGGVTIDGFAFVGSDTIPEDSNGFTNTIVVDEENDVIGNVTIRSSVLDGKGEVTRAVQLTTIDSGPFTIEDTTIHGYFLGINGYGDDVTVRDSSISDVDEGGVNLQQGDDLRVLGSTVEVGDGHDGNRYAVRFGYTMASQGDPRDTNLTVRDSVLSVAIGDTDQYRHAGVIVRNSSTGNLEVSESVVFGLINDAETRVRATHNYWGSSNGPGGAGPGTGHAISGDVTFSPFYTDEDRTALATPGSDTRTSFTVSDLTPLNTEVVDVSVTVENVGAFSAQRTITLIVDDAAVRSRAVTVAAGQSRTVTFQHRFKKGTHSVTVNDSVATLSAKTVVVKRATNPDADVEITSPTAGEVSASGDVTVVYALTDADEGIAAVNYSVASGPSGQITDLNRTDLTLSGLNEGTHTATLTLVDNLGNELSSDSVSFAVDATEPVVEIAPARTDAIGANRSVAVDLSVDEANLETATFLVRDGDGDAVYTLDVTDGLADGSEAIEWDGTDDAGDALASGEYDLVLNATDAAENTNETTTTVGVDNAPPTPTVDDVSPTRVNGSGTVTVDVTATDGQSTVENVSVTLVSQSVNFRTTAEAANASGTWVATFTAGGLPVDGNYTVIATATDEASNDGSVTTADAFAADTTPPSVSAIIDTKNATTGYVNVTVADEVADATAIGLNLTDPNGNHVAVAGLSQVGSTNTYSGTFGFTGGGEYSLEANATDAAGNLGESNATANVSVLDPKRQHTITGADGTVVVLNMENDAGGLAAFTSSNSPLAALGTNVGSTFLNGELNESLTNNLDNATIRIPVDGNVPPGVDEDDVNISRYNETAGQWDLLPTEIEDVGGTRYFVTTVEHFSTYGPVSPDTTVPSITSTSLSSGSPGDTLPYATSTVDVSVGYSDNKQVNASAISVRYDGVDVTDKADASVSSSKATFRARNLVGSGQHWVNVTVVDTAGNEAYENVSFVVTEDTAGPTASLNQDTFAYGTDPISLELSYEDALSGVDTSSVAIAVDGTDVTGPATVTSTGVQYDASSDGPGAYDVVLNVSDNEGNWANESYTFSVEDDTTNPTVGGSTFSPSLTGGVLSAGTTQATVVLSYSDGVSGINTSAIEARFDDGTGATDVTDDAVITSSKLTYTAVGLQNGSAYALEADVVDNEGNSVTETVSFEVGTPSDDDGDTDGSTGASGGSTGGSTRLDRSTYSPSIVARSTSAAIADASPGAPGTTVRFAAGASSVREITFDVERATGRVVVTEFREPPADAVASAPGRLVHAVDISVPDALRNTRATVTVTVPRDRLGGEDPGGATLAHRSDDGRWAPLETTVVGATAEEVTLRAVTPGFSLFGVVLAETPPPRTATATPGEPATGTPPGTTAGPTGSPDGGTPAGSPAATTVAEPGGFDVTTVTAVALFLVVVLVLLALGRRRR